MKMCQAFAETGHDITLFAVKNHQNGYPDDLFDYYDIRNRFIVKFIPFFRIPGYGLIYALISVVRAFLYEKPDLAYGRHWPSCLLSSVLGMPTIYEFHGPMEFSRAIEHILLKIIIAPKNCKRIVVLSKKLFEYYQQYHCLPASLMKVAYNGANYSEKDNTVSIMKKNDTSDFPPFHVGYVGNIYPGKAMEIISELVRKCPWANFHIVGGKGYDLEKWKGILAAHTNCIFHGHMDHNQASKYTFLFDVLLLPSQKSVSIFGTDSLFDQSFSPPIKLFEYMRVGKPIVASDFLNEILEDGKTALLCNPEKIEPWVKALKRLYDDPELQHKLGKNARDVFTDKYTWKARAKTVLEGLIE